MGRKKKNVVIDDDEYSIGTEVSEESTTAQVEKVVPVGGKKKGKKGNSKGSQGRDEDDDDDDDDDVKLVGEDGDEASEIVFAEKKKSKSKKGGAGGSKISSFELLGDDNDKEDNEDDSPVNFTGKKSSKKGSKKGPGGFSSSAFDALGDEDDEDNTKEEEDESENDAPAVNFTGKKKPSKKGAVGFSGSAFDALGDEDDEENAKEEDDHQSEDDAPALNFTGKKKPSKKGSKKGASGFSGSAFDALGDEDGVEEDAQGENDTPVVSFSGKKKPSKKGLKKGGSTFSASAFDALGDEEGEDKMAEDDGDVDVDTITFSGKKKSSKKKNSPAFAALGDEGREDESQESSISSSSIDSKQSKVPSKEVPELSKAKKKKKKAGRTAEEEDELDKLLAELGEGPTIPKSEPASGPPPPQEEKIDTQPPPVGSDEHAAEKEEGDGEGVVESAAAKKKKKKKEKEKEKKAAAAAAKAEVKEEKPEEKKGKGPPVKVSKQVREMQEALARRKEAEERKKKEEEERLRKEEEERKRQEELERQAEEARRRKKEREKEKLLKKKQEGKLLTGKQKEEQRRLEAMRNQFLSGKGVPLPAQESKATTKRPIYTTKKSKTNQGQANGVAPAKAEDATEEGPGHQVVTEVESEETDKVDTTKVEEKDEVPVETSESVVNEEEEEKEEEEEEDDDDDEWDAKSWDDADLVLPSKSAFEDEEVESEPEAVIIKEVKKSVEPAARHIPPSTTAKPAPPAKKAAEEIHSHAVSGKKKNAVETKIDAPDSASGPELNLRSPICCIMGHVDTGKTKLLDCIRGTNVQEGEAGGITQQIGATYFPAVNIRDRTRELKADAKLNVPGLLVIDTPGHESFTNLRSRGSGLCDIAILVVDIMHGLEPQTIESINLLKMRNTEFIVALNKVDRLYGWKTCRNAPIRLAIKQQSKDVVNEFNQRLVQIITQFKEQGLNTELYYKNKEMGETYSIVPTSAISGEGIPDLLLLLVQWTQKSMAEKLTYSDEVQCTVLEVKVIEGHGTTIDVILVNGVLHEGDQIVVCGMQGPIVASIRALLTPHPMRELRVKGTYIHHKEIKAAQGIKITAQGLEHAIAGTSLHVIGPDDDVEDIKAMAMEDVKSVMSRIDKSGEGVYVQASTLGSLEALLEFLKSPAVKIPVSGIGIGPVHKKDVIRASIMLEKKKEYATILAFDVKITPEATEYAKELGVTIFMADIIYHLFDQFKAHIEKLKEEQKRESAEEAVFPCVLRIIPNCVFNKKDPIVLGVDVLEGILRVGTPICIPSRDFISIGRIQSIEINKKAVDAAKKGHQVAIKIGSSNPEEQQRMFGRHFEIEDELVSQISRKSIDILKTNYREDLSMEDWRLVVKLKNLFKIQ